MEIQASAEEKKLAELIEARSAFIDPLLAQIRKKIVGQSAMVEAVLSGLLCDGHILLEGVPGLAKTLTVSAIAAATNLAFRRIQFTPDLLPADLTGSEMYNAQTSSFYTRKGPLFANIILADEINRAPAKAQSALLEAMWERQVTIGGETFKLPEPFIVMATQNPLESAGTYPLPEAQVDRFLIKIIVDYPDRDSERRVVEKNIGRDSDSDANRIEPQIEPETIFSAREMIDGIYIDPKLIDYIIDIVQATRRPREYRLDIARYIEYGASPRASISLARLAKANAFLARRSYCSPDDVKKSALDALRHRIILTYEADADNVDSDQIIKTILEAIEVP